MMTMLIGAICGGGGGGGGGARCVCVWGGEQTEADMYEPDADTLGAISMHQVATVKTSQDPKHPAGAALEVSVALFSIGPKWGTRTLTPTPNPCVTAGAVFFFFFLLLMLDIRPLMGNHVVFRMVVGSAMIPCPPLHAHAAQVEALIGENQRTANEQTNELTNYRTGGGQDRGDGQGHGRGARVCARGQGPNRSQGTLNKH